MKRRDFIIGAGGAAAWPLVAAAQQADRIRDVGVFGAASLNSPSGQRNLAAFRQQLKELGWVDGKNIAFDYRMSADPVEAAALVAKRPDVIFDVGAEGLAALRNATSTIPIVFTQVGDPVGLGYVASLGHPGGNMTGFTSFEFSIGGKWLQLLKEIAPNIDRAAALFDPEMDPPSKEYLSSARQAAATLGIAVVEMPVRTDPEIESALSSFAAAPRGGLLTLAGNFSFGHREMIVNAAARLRLPAIYWYDVFAIGGGLMSYGVDVADEYRRGAAYIDRILRGEKPGDLPVQASDKFDLVINLKAANGIGLTVPAGLIARADQVIE